jgi:hypothetical protein
VSRAERETARVSELALTFFDVGPLPREGEDYQWVPSESEIRFFFSWEEALEAAGIAR